MRQDLLSEQAYNERASSNHGGASIRLFIVKAQFSTHANKLGLFVATFGYGFIERESKSKGSPLQALIESNRFLCVPGLLSI